MCDRWWPFEDNRGMSTASRPARIEAIFQFLKRNASINEALQVGFIRETLSPATVEERALLLLQRVMDTQASPQLDAVCQFIEPISQSGCLNSCADFRAYVARTTGSTDLWQGLRQSPGWGEKTAALLVRNLAITEKHPALGSLLWPDVDVLMRAEVRLPVDAVILAIFERLGPLRNGKVLRSFSAINSYLKSDLGYTSEDMYVWDDLWFWGFITQRSAPQQKQRIHTWNAPKYWAIPHAPKSAKEVANIAQLAHEFLALFKC